MASNTCASIAVIVLALLVTSCEGDPPPTPDDAATPTPDASRDGGVQVDGSMIVDGGSADAATVDAGPVSALAPRVFHSSGGGGASSASFRLRLAIGAPQPMGEVTSATGPRVTLGPSAARP